MNEDKQTIFTFILNIIRITDNWKKMTVLLFLMVFTVIGTGGYYFRHRIDEWLSSRLTQPSLNIRHLNTITRDVMTGTGVIAVTVWEANHTDNYRSVLYVTRQHGVINQEPYPEDVLFSHVPDKTTLMVSLMEHNIYCYLTHDYPNLHLVISSEPVMYVCAVAIPPDYGLMQGIIAAGFNHPPKNLELVRKKLIRAAWDSITNR